VADTTGRGAVADLYLISKYETTNAQYAQFLNAVAATDTFGLYNTNMAGPSPYGGIRRSGSPGSYTYSVIGGRGSKPVNYVSPYDALRFANWLHNGQPSGAQDSTTTEDGAYTFTGPTSVGERNVGARIFLPSEDEWYKAAYYNAVSHSYFNFPAGSDVQTTCAAAGATPNTANCDFVVGDLTNVGSYTGSASPNGTFDQGGNVWEWSEAFDLGPPRSPRGGCFFTTPYCLRASSNCIFSTDESQNIGFRVAMIPEPSTALLLATGLAGLAARGRRRPLR
jgi:formylglycine-generating enzyme required for sulfatase activity